MRRALLIGVCLAGLATLSGQSGEPKKAAPASATIEVKVNASADVFFYNHRTTQRGPARTFTTPPLEPGHKYYYTITAVWAGEGKTNKVSRDITVTAGEKTVVDFTDGKATDKDKTKEKKPKDKVKDTGFVPLFNGKDLTGWKTHPKEPGMWSVEGGAIVGRGKDRSHLFSERGDFENFHYRVEAKIGDKGNSGQYFRTTFGPGYPKGYEAQINSTFPDPQKTGSLYGFAPIKEMLVPPDTWFTQEVIAKGNHIQIIVNGKKVVDYTDEKKTHTRGHFAFQQHSPAKGGPDSVVYIRKAEVKELK